LQEKQAAHHPREGDDLVDHVIAGEEPDIEGVEEFPDRTRSVVSRHVKTPNCKGARAARVVNPPVIQERNVDGVIWENDPMSAEQKDQGDEDETWRRPRRSAQPIFDVKAHSTVA
jgi:hypothetical protein